VVGTVSGRPGGDAGGREAPDQALDRLMAFLRVVKYRPSGTNL
jgi:hypothetical protein